MADTAPNKSVDNRKPDGTFGPGNVANPNGRPKGKTLKEFAREWLMTMNDEDKKKFISELSPEVVWKMAEGNPHQSSDEKVTVIQPTPILANVQGNNSHIESDVNEEKN